MRYFLFITAVLATPGWLLSDVASDPDWWSEPDTAIIVNPLEENNYAPVTLGQLKHVAEMAMKHLDIELSTIGGSSPFPFVEVATMVAGFQDYQGLPPGENPNYSPINLGQLKAVAEPFYDRLLQIGYDTRQNLIDHDYDPLWPHDYPWNPETPPEENYAPAKVYGDLEAALRQAAAP